LEQIITVFFDIQIYQPESLTQPCNFFQKVFQR
jgi:hypothetical protein